MYVLVPIEITNAMLSGDPIAEPDASVGEVAWVSGGAYTVDQERTSNGGIYSCVADHTGVATLPENDAVNWLYKRPTNRQACFDNYINTASKVEGGGSLTRVVKPGFFNTANLYGLWGSRLIYTYKDEPGGTVLKTDTLLLVEDVADYYEWAFSEIEQKTRVLITGLEPYPEGELTVEIEAQDNLAEVGLLALGDLRPLSVTGEGGTEFGASAEPIDYSYIDTEDDGTVRIVQRHSATGMKASVLLKADDTASALRTLQKVLAKPVCYIASLEEEFDGLNVFGLGKSSLTYASATHRKLTLTVTGSI